MEWISVEERLPDVIQGHSEPIIVVDGESVIDDCSYIPEWGGFIVHAYGEEIDRHILTDVTHWMYLPEPPK